MVRTSFPEIGAEPMLQSLTAGCAFQRRPRTSASHAHNRQERVDLGQSAIRLLAASSCRWPRAASWHLTWSCSRRRQLRPTHHTTRWEACRQRITASACSKRNSSLELST